MKNKIIMGMFAFAFMLTAVLTGQKSVEAAAETQSPQSSAEAEGNSSEDWVADLKLAKDSDQILVVAAEEVSDDEAEISENGSPIHRATVSLHTKDSDGTWTEVLSSEGFVGKHGIGKTKEGDGKTPTGVYGFSDAFGIAEDPGCAIPYVRVDDTYYWVDDSDSSYYNKLVSTDTVETDWTSGEHIVDYPKEYKYTLGINYNADGTPGLGSAIFLHCSAGVSTAGCVAVPEDDMVEIMKNVQEDCVILIDYESEIQNY